MGESSDSEANDKVVLLPWYSNLEIFGKESIAGYEENLLVPWYSSSANRGQETSLGHEEASTSTILPTNMTSQFVRMGFPENIVRKAIEENGESSTELMLETLLRYSGSTSESPPTNMISHFVGMGFPEKIVRDAIKENGESNTDLLLETLLTYSALNSEHGSKSEKDGYDAFSASDNYRENEVDAEHIPEKDKKLLHLIDMGFSAEEASSAIDASGSDTSIIELMDFICAAHTAKMDETSLQEPPQPTFYNDEMGQDGYQAKKKKKRLSEAEEIWEGILNDPMPMFPRKISNGRQPFFYIEDIECIRKGGWSIVSRIYEVKSEFVDSLHFSPVARERGFVHNLPTHNRYHLLPIPPLTIQEAFPQTKKYWPSWDKRTKLNLNTTVATPKLTQRVQASLDGCGDVPPLSTQKNVVRECTEWNLVWVGRNDLARLEPGEIEMVLGYPRYHSRGGGISMTDRYKVLGDSFQVDTIGYHLSVLKSMFPDGINVLSLFTGIGGALVALDRLQIPLKNVISLEPSEVSRNIIRGWWTETQVGKLIEIEDMRQVSQDRLEHLSNSIGGFDLIIGGTPCSYRGSREGLQGSVPFDEYCRIMKIFKCLIEKKKK